MKLDVQIWSCEVWQIKDVPKFSCEVGGSDVVRWNRMFR